MLLSILRGMSNGTFKTLIGIRDQGVAAPCSAYLDRLKSRAPQTMEHAGRDIGPGFAGASAPGAASLKIGAGADHHALNSETIGSPKATTKQKITAKPTGPISASRRGEAGGGDFAPASGSRPQRRRHWWIERQPEHRSHRSAGVMAPLRSMSRLPSPARSPDLGIAR